MNSLTVRPELVNQLRRRILVKLGGPETDGAASNSQLGRILDAETDVVGRHTRALEEAGLVAAGVRGRTGVLWSLTESGRAQRALLLAQAAGVL